jgi:hypothetical protein
VFVHGWFSATAEFGFYLTFLLPQAWIYDLLIAVIPIINRHAKGFVQILDYSLAGGCMPLFISNQHFPASSRTASFVAWRLGWVLCFWPTPEDFMLGTIGGPAAGCRFLDLSW